MHDKLSPQAVADDLLGDPIRSWTKPSHNNHDVAAPKRLGDCAAKLLRPVGQCTWTG